MVLTRRGRVVAVLSIAAGILVVVALSARAVLASWGLVGASRPGRTVEVVIPEGVGTAQIGDLLEAKGVIRSAFGFRVAAYLEDGAEEIQAGRYLLPVGLTAPDALRALLGDGPVTDFVMVTFPEGSWLSDFARVLDRETHISGDDFLELATTSAGPSLSPIKPPDVATMEGLLFPSTYQVVEDDTARSLLRRLARELVAQMEDLDLSAVEAMGYSPYEVVIVASMVEAEAGVEQDRARIARVIYNRLDAGIPLGIDATVIYALGEHKQVLTRTDLEVDSPYNTRIVAGLPPTPIGAPGAASLAAAAAPAEGDWLYYVLADCEGRHAFSETYAEFLEDKAAYQALVC